MDETEPLTLACFTGNSKIYTYTGVTLKSVCKSPSAWRLLAPHRNLSWEMPSRVPVLRVEASAYRVSTNHQTDEYFGTISSVVRRQGSTSISVAEALDSCIRSWSRCWVTWISFVSGPEYPSVLSFEWGLRVKESQTCSKTADGGNVERYEYVFMIGSHL